MGTGSTLVKSFIMVYNTAAGWHIMLVRRKNECESARRRKPVECFRRLFGYEGLQGEGKPRSSDTAKLVNWQAARMAQIWRLEAGGAHYQKRGGNRNYLSTRGCYALRFNQSICLLSLQNFMQALGIYKGNSLIQKPKKVYSWRKEGHEWMQEVR